MRWKILIAAAIAAMILPAGAGLADTTPASPLSASLQAASVETQPDGTQTLAPASSSAPGKVLQYTGHYTNISTAPLAGVIIDGQIPTNTVFLPAGLSASPAAMFEVLVAGEAWQALPAHKTVKQADGTVTRVEAQPADYQQIRWRLAQPLQPGITFISVYRVRVNQ